MVELQKYWIETTVDDFAIDRGAFDGIIVEEGVCRASPDNLNARVDIAGYDVETLGRLIADHQINDGSDGPYDDRKMRYHNSIDSDGNLLVRMGHSHFLEYKESGSRSAEEAERMVALGEEHYEDRFAFFPRNPGVTGIVRTSDGGIIIGYRTFEGDGVFDGLLQGAAAHLKFEQNPSDARIGDQMRTAFKTEYGIEPGWIENMEFLGLFSFADQYGDDLDFGWMADVNLPNDYFTGDSWRANATKPNHTELIAIPDYATLEELTRTGQIAGQQNNIVFSTRGPLEQLTVDDFS